MIEWDDDIDLDCPSCTCCTEADCCVSAECIVGQCRCWTDQPPEAGETCAECGSPGHYADKHQGDPEDDDA